ncbi:MAG: hypothetical protein FD126_1172 [Elusimicrobia bacterium]|nr:MAG: hypothetical protein FD126_1172 [Elusimicrobiota bacterium]
MSIPPQAPWQWFIPSNKAGYPRLELADAVPFDLSTPLGEVTAWERRKEPESGVLTAHRRRVRVRMAAGSSSLTLHHHGVRVHGTVLEDLALPMAVDVDDSALILDASLAAPVEGPALERAVAAGRRAAVKHGVTRLEHHTKTMRLCSRLLLARPDLRRLWGLSLLAKERVGRRVPWLIRAQSAFKGRVSLSGDALRVVRAAEFTSYLRIAAMASLQGRAIDARDPLRDALWQTPLVFSATGRPLSLAELDIDERHFTIWEGSRPAPAGAGAMMPWAIAADDGVFVMHFPKRKARVG